MDKYVPKKWLFGCFVFVTVLALFVLIDDDHPLATNVKILKSQMRAMTDIGAGGIFPKWQGSDKPEDDVFLNTKWIVVTSINHPTEDIKRLASLDDWSLVVVADTKTPVDWNLEGVHFLSVDRQIESGLLLPRELPFKTYTRKNVGYLYAIQHGAEWIYDTDDDNKPYGLGLDQFDYTEKVSGLRYVADQENTTIAEKVFNPYSYFGNAEMWPRGFPLEYISNHTNGEDRMLLCREMRTAVVQQGIVHKDPDVDAIYRLLKASPTSGLNSNFNQFAPPIVLNEGTYSPWNSQNTLFHRRAFFTMFLPTTVEFRVTDIWRSYFSQKLLHLIGENVAFYPVNAIQIRNAHDYLADFEDERAVYLKSGAIVRFLNEWDCDLGTTEMCTVELARMFREEGFIEDEDVRLVELWVRDLNTIGYEFPPLSEGVSYEPLPENESMSNCRRANLELRNDLPHNISQLSMKRAQQKVDDFGDLLDWCNTTDAANASKPGIPSPKQLAQLHSQQPVLVDKLRTVLVITNNFPWTKSIGLLQRLYQPYFAVTVFCGSWYPESYQHNERNPPIRHPFNYIHVNPEEMRKGYFGYICLSKARDLRLQNVDGYFVMSDDALFNIWVSTPLDVVVHPKGTGVADKGGWWSTPMGRSAAKKIVELVQGKYANDTRVQAAWSQYSEGIAKFTDFNGTAEEHFKTATGKSISDFYYIPTSQLDYFSDMLEIFREARFFHELALSKLLHSVEHERFPMHRYLWGGTRGEWHLIYNSSLLMEHPIKFSWLENKAKSRNRFCSSVIETFRKMLYSR